MSNNYFEMPEDDYFEICDLMTYLFNESDAGQVIADYINDFGYMEQGGNLKRLQDLLLTWGFIKDDKK